MGQFNLISEEVFAQKMDEQNTLLMGILAGQGGIVIPKSWEQIQYLIRNGMASQYFPVGYEFVTHDSVENTDIVWRVVGYDTIKAADESLQHTMVLETEKAYSNSNGTIFPAYFDEEEFLYFCENQLDAGTYHFTLLNGYEEEYGGGKTYSFTLTQPVPAGGVVLFPWTATTQAAETSVITYSSAVSDTAIETVGVTEGASGTLLGTADGTSPGMNHTHRIHYGSNNYAQSAIRQWLNSDETVSTWEPQTIVDKPSSKLNKTGLMARLPQEFLSVIQPAVIPCRTSGIYEINSLDGTVYTTNQIYYLEDRFFILSRAEIDGTYENHDIQDGAQLEFYDGLSDSERIAYAANGVAVTKRLRTASGTDTSLTTIVNTFGKISSTSARLGTGICPACIIA